MDDEVAQAMQELSDAEGSRERMLQEQADMTMEERLAHMDALCRDVTRLASAAQRSRA